MITSEKKCQRLILFFLFLFLPLASIADKKIVNVYSWASEMPDVVIKQFEKETGIKVNFSTYESNEIMYAKLRSAKNTGYDVIVPSSYFVDRMRRQHMLEKLDKKKLPLWKNVDPAFLHLAYDPTTDYSVPFVWGVTGIFFNRNDYPPHQINTWSDLWDPHYNNQIMLLDDVREVFSIALISLGYSANDHNPEHINAAFLKLKTLMTNVKMFAVGTVVSIMIDEDATLGIAWNGDAVKAHRENPAITFVFPKEGFVIWVDNFSIPRGAPHPDTAYAFINFMMRPDVAKTVALATRYAITNLAAKKMLPADIRNDPTAYPSQTVLQHGQFQTDVGDDTLALFEKYWEELKMSG